MEILFFLTRLHNSNNNKEISSTCTHEQNKQSTIQEKQRNTKMRARRQFPEQQNISQILEDARIRKR